MKLARLLSRIACAAAIVNVALAAAATQAAPAQASPWPTVFTFAAGYKADSPAPHNVVELGVIRDCDGGLCMETEDFDSAKSLHSSSTAYMHEMHAPYGGTACFDGPVQTVNGSREQGKVTVHRTPEGFDVVTHRFLYRWVADPKVRSGYKLAELIQSGASTPLDQVVGFAFASDSEMKGRIDPSQLGALYKGEIYHKTALTRVDGAWEFAPSSIDFRPYKQAEHGNVLIRTIPGDPRVVQKYGKPMWVQSTLVLERDNKSIAPLVQEYGHDFNMDGCFDEAGHNKLLLPVGQDNVDAFVYIEYTSDFMRGFPMLSVGRYYR